MLTKSWLDSLNAFRNLNKSFLLLQYLLCSPVLSLYPPSNYMAKGDKKENISSSYFPLKKWCNREKNSNNVERGEAGAEQLNNKSLIYLLRFLPQEKGDGL